MQFLYDLQHDVRNLANTIATVFFQTPNIDIGEIVIGPAFSCSNTNLGRRGLVIDLDPGTT